MAHSATKLSVFLVLCFLSIGYNVEAQSSIHSKFIPPNEVNELVKKYPYGNTEYTTRKDLNENQKKAIYVAHFKTFYDLPVEQRKAYWQKNPEVKTQMEKERVFLSREFGRPVSEEQNAKYPAENQN